MAGILGNLQDFIDWVYALYVDINDRLNALEDEPRRSYKPLKVNVGESVISNGLFSLVFGSGWKLFGTGAAEFGKLILRGYTTVLGTIDFTDAHVIGLRLGGGTGGGATEIVFSQANGVEGLTSPPYAPKNTVTLSEIRALVSTGPTGSLTITVRVNGTSVGSVTLGTGVTDASSTLSASVTTSDKVQVSASAGSGAQGLAAIVRYT